MISPDEISQGKKLNSTSNPAEVIEIMRPLFDVEPNNAKICFELGLAYQKSNDSNNARFFYQKTIELDPYCWRALINLGTLLFLENESNNGLLYLRQAYQIAPQQPDVIQNLTFALCNCRLSNEAMPIFLQAIADGVITPSTYSSFLYNLHYEMSFSSLEILQFHRLWDKTFKPAKTAVSQKFESIDNRKIRIGYVSANFSLHSVAYFLLPILRFHNPDLFEIHCFSSTKTRDSMTDILQSLAGYWHEITRLNDEAAAELIIHHGIDILVDLGGHTQGNRLTLFQLKPAKVQVNYLGYPDTTGLSTMDFRISDALADPQNRTDNLHTEKLVRLKQGFLCYKASNYSPEIGELPYHQNNFITFGCFNNMNKITQACINLWSEILKAVPGSILVLKSQGLGDASIKSQLFKSFELRSVDQTRIRLLDGSPSVLDHLLHYNKIDIALDTFPYNGTTTTCEALWMGVPTVSLAGDTHVSRVGYSILANNGLSELVADTPQKYIEIAFQLAHNIPLLNHLRHNLRTHLENSPLTNGPQFVAELEQQFIAMLN